jgi:hypothetical protein
MELDKEYWDEKMGAAERADLRPFAVEVMLFDYLFDLFKHAERMDRSTKMYVDLADTKEGEVFRVFVNIQGNTVFKKDVRVGSGRGAIIVNERIRIEKAHMAREILYYLIMYRKEEYVYPNDLPVEKKLYYYIVAKNEGFAWRFFKERVERGLLMAMCAGDVKSYDSYISAVKGMMVNKLENEDFMVVDSKQVEMMLTK